MARTNRTDKATTQTAPKWYDQRLNSLGLVAAAWLAGWLVLLHALNTASMWSYLALYVLLIFGLNRLVRAIRGKRGRQTN